ncbi:Ubiquitin-protein ligase E3 [Schizosaccharomyces pombe]
MPLSFEGTFKAKRNVNLGGKRVSNDRAQLLRKAAMERKNREEERKAENNSVAVQSLSRGFLARRKFKQDFRERWIYKYTKSGRTSIRFNTLEDIKCSISLLVLFAEPDIDLPFVSQVAHNILVWLENLIPLSNGMDDTPKSHLKVKISKVQETLSNSNDSWLWQRFSSLLLNCLVSSINSHRIEGTDTSAETSLLHCLAYVAPYLKSSELSTYYDSVMTFYAQIYPKQNMTNLEDIMSLSLLTPVSSKTDENANSSSAFLFHVLASDCFSSIENCIPPDLIIDKVFSSSLHLSGEACISSLLNLGMIKVFSLAGNCLHLLHTEYKNSSLWKFCSYILDALYVFSEESVNSRIQVVSDVDDDEDDENAFSQNYYSHLQMVAKHFSKNYANQSGIVQRSFAECISSTFITKAFKLVSSNTLQAMSHFYATMIKLFPSNRTSILMYISLVETNEGSLTRSFSRFSWDMFSESPVYQLFHKKFDVQNVLKNDSGYWFQLQLLIDVYSRMLFTMIDDEFHNDKQNPLYPVMAEFCTVLKNLVLGLYWDVQAAKDVDCKSVVDISQLRVSSTSLLQQLYRINSRKQFLPEDFFLMSEYFNLNEFEANALQESELASHAEAEINITYKFDNFSESRPRLNILNNCSFFLPFHFRIHLLQQLLLLDKQANGYAQPFGHLKHAVIRRNRIFDDGFDAFYNFGKLLKGPIRITFVDEHGVVEEGIDGGGLTKEFLTSICKTVFDINYGLFSETKAHLLYPNTHAYAQDVERLRCYEFLGMLIGKCIYEGIQIDAAFASFFVAKWLGHPSYFDDLTSLDPNLYEGLVFLKNYDGDVENDMALNFTVVHEEFGVRNVIDLIPNGSNISVTNENRLQYIHLVSNYYLNARLSRQCRAFTNGFTQIIDPHWLAMFHESEIQILVGGDPVPIDIDDLRRHTVYAGGYEPNSPTIVLFWEVLREFEEEDKRSFVKFVTSVARPPILGFKALMPSFCIRVNGEDETRLPTASTCVNLLKLPMYSTKQTLRDKLLTAVRSGVGFGFS